MNNIEFYKFGFNHYFIDNDNNVEGTIVLKEHNHFGEIYMSLSHLEFDDDDIDDAIKEAYHDYVFDNLYEVVNVGKI
jgi:hypothetical protein